MNNWFDFNKTLQQIKFGSRPEDILPQLIDHSNHKNGYIYLFIVVESSPLQTQSANWSGKIFI